MDKRAEMLVREPLKERELKKSKKKKEEKEVMKPTDIFRFPPTFWLLSIICLAYYAAIFPFISLGQVFFMKEFMFNKSEANMINGRASQSAKHNCRFEQGSFSSRSDLLAVWTRLSRLGVPAG